MEDDTNIDERAQEYETSRRIKGKTTEIIRRGIPVILSPAPYLSSRNVCEEVCKPDEKFNQLEDKVARGEELVAGEQNEFYCDENNADGGDDESEYLG